MNALAKDAVVPVLAKSMKVRKPRQKKLPPVLDSPPSSANMDLIRKFADGVYTELGPGHTESIYHNAMKIQIQDAGLPYESERDIPVLFKGRYVGTVRADLIVNHEIVLEFKISGKMDDAMLQCRQYMKLQSIPQGYVVLFPKNTEGKVHIEDCSLPEKD